MPDTYDHDRLAVSLRVLSKHLPESEPTLVGLYMGLAGDTVPAIILSTATARLRACLASGIGIEPLLTAIALDLDTDRETYDISAQGLIGAVWSMRIAQPEDDALGPAGREIATPPEPATEGPGEQWRYLAAAFDDGCVHEQLYNPANDQSAAAVIEAGHPEGDRSEFRGLHRLLAAIGGGDVLTAPMQAD